MAAGLPVVVMRPLTVRPDQRIAIASPLNFPLEAMGLRARGQDYAGDSREAALPGFWERLWSRAERGAFRCAAVHLGGLRPGLAMLESQRCATS